MLMWPSVNMSLTTLIYGVRGVSQPNLELQCPFTFYISLQFQHCHYLAWWLRGITTAR